MYSLLIKLLLSHQLIAVFFIICINHLKTKRRQLYLKIQSVPHSTYFYLCYKTSQLMLYREIIVVCSEIHTKHINIVGAERKIIEC